MGNNIIDNIFKHPMSAKVLARIISDKIFKELHSGSIEYELWEDQHINNIVNLFGLKHQHAAKISVDDNERFTYLKTNLQYEMNQPISLFGEEDTQKLLNEILGEEKYRRHLPCVRNRFCPNKRFIL